MTSRSDLTIPQLLLVRLGIPEAQVREDWDDVRKNLAELRKVGAREAVRNALRALLEKR